MKENKFKKSQVIEFEKILDNFQNEYSKSRAAGMGNMKAVESLVEKLHIDENSHLFTVDATKLFRNELYAVHASEKFTEELTYEVILYSVYAHILYDMFDDLDVSMNSKLPELFRYCYRKRYVEKLNYAKYKLLLNITYGLLSNKNFGIKLSSGSMMQTFSERFVNIFRGAKSIVAVDLDKIYVTNKSDYDEIFKPRTKGSEISIEKKSYNSWMKVFSDSKKKKINIAIQNNTLQQFIAYANR